MRHPNRLLAEAPTTVFTVMSALAVQHGAINLGQGFPDTEGPSDIVRAAADALLDGRNQYAPLTGLPELKRAVADANARFYGLQTDPDTEVVVTSGATEALAASLAALLEPGDEVVLFEPLYDTYVPAVRLLGGVPRLVRFQPPTWRLDPAALEAAFTPRTKLVLLNTPMNPTGKVWTREELQLLAALVERHDAYAVCDEVYEHLVFPGVTHLPLMALPGMRERCIRIGSAGKSFSLTGWKVGYLSAPAPLAAVVAKAHQNLVFATPPNLQRAVALGLSRDEDYFRDLGAALAARCTLLSEGLSALGFDVLPASAGYFAVADIRRVAGPGESDVAFCRRMTAEGGVAAIPVSAFYAAPDAPDRYLRFAFCKRDGVLREALDRLGRFLRGDSAPRSPAPVAEPAGLRA